MVNRMYVLYDSTCGVCSRLRIWMLDQESAAELEFVPAGSDRARRLFPELAHDERPAELLVISDEGDVYVDDAAWIMCLYVLVEYRDWSFRFARGPLRPLARGAWEFLSANRRQLSTRLSLKSDAELRREMELLARPECEIPNAT